jgi:PST family polysaccharide transporter
VLAVTGQDFVVILLGPKWAPAGPLLCIFAIRGIAHSIERTMGWIHVAAGRSDRWMRWGVFSAVFQLLALAAGLPFGVIGVTVAYTIAMFGLFLPALVYAGRPAGIGARDVLQAVGPQVAGGLVAVALGFLMQEALLADVIPLVRFLVSVPVCLAIYVAVVVGVFKVTGPFWLAVSMLRNLGPMRSPQP